MLSPLDALLQETTVVSQGILQAQYNQQAVRVSADTYRITTEQVHSPSMIPFLYTFLIRVYPLQQAIITVRNANASAYASVTVAQAQANAKIYSISQEASAYASVARYASVSYLLLCTCDRWCTPPPTHTQLAAPWG